MCILVSVGNPIAVAIRRLAFIDNDGDGVRCIACVSPGESERPEPTDKPTLTKRTLVKSSPWFARSIFTGQVPSSAFPTPAPARGKK